MMASNGRGMPSTTWLSGVGALCTCLYAMANGFSPLNGGCPETIS